MRGRRIEPVKQYSHIRKHKERVSVVFPAVFGGNKDRGHLETRKKIVPLLRYTIREGDTFLKEKF